MGQTRPETDWADVASRIGGLVSGETHWLCTLANASAVLAEALDDINWVGFYLASSLLGVADGKPELWLGPFQGKAACERIAFGRGVCGTAAARGESIVVEDVHAFPGHIACDAASRSEVVVPIVGEVGVLGVIDVDSPVPARFSEADAAGLAQVATLLSGVLAEVACAST